MLKAPETLNGYPVVKAAIHDNCVTVMVERKDESYLPFVVATWWPELKRGWSWGHYVKERFEADEEFSTAERRNWKR